MLALAVGPVDPFWPCAPAVRRSPHRLSTCTFAGGKKNPEHKGRRKRRGGARKTAGGNSNGARPKAPKKLPLVTGPPKIETQSVLQAVAPTLDPWWSTFVSHVEGVWAGKCAAFNMADGKMEPMMIEGDNIKIKELHTRVREAVRFPSAVCPGIRKHAITEARQPSYIQIHYAEYVYMMLIQLWCNVGGSN